MLLYILRKKHTLLILLFLGVFRNVYGMEIDDQREKGSSESGKRTRGCIPELILERMCRENDPKQLFTLGSELYAQADPEKKRQGARLINSALLKGTECCPLPILYKVAEKKLAS